MTEKNQVYKCEICGNMTEVLHTGSGTLVCCGQNMILLEEKTQDEGLEKHVPIIEKTETGFLIKVGEILHPMDDNHYIEWIELETENIIYRKELSPGDKPEVEFCTSAEKVTAREHCNIHGLWKSK